MYIFEKKNMELKWSDFKITEFNDPDCANNSMQGLNIDWVRKLFMFILLSVSSICTIVHTVSSICSMVHTKSSICTMVHIL